jgi:hypothetical protein
MNNEDPILPEEAVKNLMQQALCNMGFESFESYSGVRENAARQRSRTVAVPRLV